jgi:hypothetical protein
MTRLPAGCQWFRDNGKLGVLKTLTRFLLLAVVIQPPVFGWGDCTLPPSLCEQLKPGMVVFIGKQVSLARDQYHLPTVTFKIQEQLWGPANLRVVTVFFADGYRESNEPQFLAVTPTGNGHYRHDNCGSGLRLPVQHPWVQEFRRNVTEHKPAKVSIVVHSPHNYVPVAGTQVQLSGKGHVFKGKTCGTLALDLGVVPPGDYQATAIRPNFTQEGGQEQVSILPGSCAPLRIPMAPTSSVSGRIVDSRGESVRKKFFLLMGQVRAITEKDSIYDSVVESARNFFFQIGWMRSGTQDYLASHSARTDSDGRFAFKGVFPGRYYLVSDISDEASKLPFPKTYYPGTYEWRRAIRLQVEEGRSFDKVFFQLPDFGKKRRVEIQVVSEDGVPVAGAIVQDSGLDPSNEKAANVGAQRVTDIGGRVVFDVWPICDYRLVAYLYLPKKWHSSDVLDVPSGSSSFSAPMALKGLRLKGN